MIKTKVYTEMAMLFDLVRFSRLQRLHLNTSPVHLYSVHLYYLSSILQFNSGHFVIYDQDNHSGCHCLTKNGG